MDFVIRSEILDYAAYEEQRESISSNVMAIKQPRRIHPGEQFTFFFENHDTIRYQIQEVLRMEKIVNEEEIAHEIDTYNQILGRPGDLSATLLINVVVDDDHVSKLKDLSESIYLILVNGIKVFAEVDSKQEEQSRLSSSHYLKFRSNGHRPIAIGIDHPDLKKEVLLTSEQQNALREDATFEEIEEEIACYC